MSSTLTIGVAQFTPARGDIDTNLNSHIQLIDEAANADVDVLVFPELSLTGYELELAAELALSPAATPLLTLQEKATQHDMIILASAPLAIPESKPELALFILSPNAPISHYSKMNLHGAENTYFSQGHKHVLLQHKSFSLALAVCADIANPAHAQQAADIGADCYIASVLISKAGYATDASLLSNYAREHSFYVAMANFTGQFGTWDCAGKSSIWDKNGNVLKQAHTSSTAIEVTTLQK